MKRQFFAIGFAAVSALTSLSISTPAQAFPEQEPNNRSKPMLIYLSNSTRVTSVTGKVNDGDDQDVFRFYLDRHADIEVTLNNLSGDADLILNIDNGDGKLAGGDARRPSDLPDGKTPEKVILRQAKPGWYFVTVEDSQGGFQPINYTLNVQPTRTYSHVK